MKTPDKIKNGLECVINYNNPQETCAGCPYSEPPKEKDHMWICDCPKIYPDALSYIEQLEADNVSKDERIQMLEAGMAQWEDVAASPGAVEDMARENHRLTQELEAVKRERDAAVSDMKRAQGCICNICKSYYRPDPAIRHYECKVFGKFSEIYENDDDRPFVCGKFKWRGVCPDNTEV